MKPHPCSYNADQIPPAKLPNIYFSSIFEIANNFRDSFHAFYDSIEAARPRPNSTATDYWISEEDYSYSDFNSATIPSFDVGDSSKELARNLNKLNTIAYFYITPIIIGFGVVGDILSIAVLSHPLLRKTSVVYSYLLALAVTDLLTLISVIPPILWIMKIKLCTLAAARYYAHVGFPLANAFMGASVYIVVFLTFNQYMAVCHPFVRSDLIRSRRNCLILTAIAYALSFALYIPWAWRKSVRYVGDSHSSFESCPYEACDNVGVVDSFWYKTYQWTREMISRFIPFLFIAYFNLRMLYMYRRTRAHSMSIVNSCVQKLTLRQKTEREQRRLWALLFGIMTLFFVCTIPAAPFTIMVSDRLEHNLTFQTVRAITNVLEFTKFALNFYLYCMINPDIRRLCMKRLTCQNSLNIVRAPMVGSKNSYHLSDLLQMGERRLAHGQALCNNYQKRISVSGTGGTTSGSNDFSCGNKLRRSLKSRKDSEKPLLSTSINRNVEKYHANEIRSALIDLGRRENSKYSPVHAASVARSPAAVLIETRNGFTENVNKLQTDIILHGEPKFPSISSLSFSEMFNDGTGDMDPPICELSPPGIF